MSTCAIESPGCVILLIDESAAMQSAVQEEPLELGQEPKTKGVATANAVNSLLKQLSTGPDFDLAIVGYRSSDSGASVAQVRWSGPLAGREFVSTKDLGDNPVAIETRQRRIPDPSSFSGFRSEPVDVPVWYASESGGIAPQVLAFETCKQLLERWSQTAGPNPGQPLVIHLFAGASGDGNPSKAIEELREFTVGGQQPLVLHAHLSTAKAVPPIAYSSNRMFIPAGPARDLFERSSPLPRDLISALKGAKVVVGENARGMLFNAKMIDIVRFLALVKTHVQTWPPRSTGTAAAPAEAVSDLAVAAPETPMASEVPDDAVIVDSAVEESQPQASGGERAALVVFLMDRSVEDPYAADSNNPCIRLVGQANDWLGKLAKKPSDQIDVAVVSYGVDFTGEAEVRNTFDAGLTGRTVVRDTELETGAIRIVETEQQLPNGIGGLMAVPMKQLILVELEPTAAAPPVAAFDAVAAIVQEWSGQHPQACVPPVVLHLTRGQHSAGDLEAGAAKIQGATVASGAPLLYHAIATQAPHTSLSYCENDAELETVELKAAFAVSSPLLGRAELAQSKPALVKPESRGIVVNGKFDLLLDGIRSALACQ